MPTLDRVIVWLNGAFGVGKTTTARELLAVVPGSRVFDPETVGAMLRDNLADRPTADFQQWAPWRSLVVATAAELTTFTGQHLVCPQTLLAADYLDEVLGGLADRGLRTLHVLLDVDETELRRRIEASAQARQWRLEHMAEYAAARDRMRARADVVVDTSSIPVAEVATRISRQILRELPATGSGRASST